MPWDEAQVHVLTHTLHYGLGAFEGIRCYKRRDGKSAVFRLAEHIDRLFESAHIGDMALRWSREEVVGACLDACGPTSSMSVTCGRWCSWAKARWGFTVATTHPAGGRGVALGAYLGDEGLEKGVRAKISSYTRLERQQRHDQGQAGRQLCQLHPRQA